MSEHLCPVCESASRQAPPISGHLMRRCNACELVFAADRNIPPTLYQTLYTDDEHYHMGLEQAKAQAAGAAGFDWMMEWVIGRLKPRGGKRILDLGCGVGSALFLAKRAGWTGLFGQDLSETAMRAGKEVFGIETFDCPIEQIADSGERFDAITAFNLLEHVPRPLAYMKTVRRLLNDDGQFGVIVPNYDSYAMRHTKYDLWLPPFHVNFFTLQTLSSMLERVGLHVTEHTVRFTSWSGIPGSTFKKLALAPYLVGNALIGRLRGNAVLAIARVSAH